MRALPIPKRGGVLPLALIFADLLALDILTKGASTIAKKNNVAKDGRKQFAEAKSHNRIMEVIAINGKKGGAGLYLKLYRENQQLGISIQGRNIKKSGKVHKRNYRTFSRNIYAR